MFLAGWLYAGTSKCIKSVWFIRNENQRKQEESGGSITRCRQIEGHPHQALGRLGQHGRQSTSQGNKLGWCSVASKGKLLSNFLCVKIVVRGGYCLFPKTRLLKIWKHKFLLSTLMISNTALRPHWNCFGSRVKGKNLLNCCAFDSNHTVAQLLVR